MTPYADTAARYWEAGWKGVLPLPAGRKKSPPPGYTGYGAPYLSYADVYALCESDGAGNICLRLPADVIGIDVDDYDDKPGAASLAALASVCGPLPATWISTSRAGPSGIRLYRVPPGGSWTGNPAAGIEIIQAAHRYAVVWPSTHPEGRTYRWYDPYGAPTETIPKPDELPELPAAWLAALISSREHAHAIALTYPQAQTWLDACRPGPLCSIVAGVLNRYLERLAHPSGEARHDLAMAGTRALVAFGGEGHCGAKDATSQLGEAFLSAVCDPAAPGATREAGEATKEYLSLLAGAVRLAAAVDATPRERCEHDAPAPGTSGTAASGSGSPVADAGSALEDEEPTLRLVSAATVIMRKVRWLWHDRIPIGEITLIAGREGCGKSTYLADLTAKITLGKAEGEHLGIARAVIYLAAEDSWAYTIAPRLTAAGADLSRVFYAESIEIDGVVLPRDVHELERLAIDVGAAAIMCDPIISLVDGRYSTDRTKELRQVLEPLRRTAERAHCAVPALAHFRKSEGDSLTRIAGARGWVEVARACIGMIRDEESGHYVFSQLKNNLGRLDLPNHSYRIVGASVSTADGPSEVSRIEWLGQVDTGFEEIYENQRRASSGSSASSGKPRKSETSEIIRLVVDNEQMSVQEVIMAFPDLTERLVRNALATGVQSGELTRVRTGIYGAPPTDPAE